MTLREKCQTPKFHQTNQDIPYFSEIHHMNLLIINIKSGLFDSLP